MQALEFYGKLNLMKSGILYSDVVSTVSRRYAKEILTPEFGCGLEGLLETRKERLYGIVNGADYSVWSPEKDRFTKVNYDASSIEKKKECKKDLIEYAGLDVSVDAPLLGCVTRLVDQKGMDLVAGIMESIVRSGVGFVLLGKGDGHYQRLFQKLAKKYPGNVSFCMEFNDELAHKIEAGCDIFLMPSRYEPCGLNQMYSLRYGTIPVVRATGGLDDAIIDFDEDREKGNGFKFYPADKDALHSAIDRAISCYKDSELWHKLIVQAMSYDFSWTHSAKEYMKLYRRLMV
jgi:starch synthase